MKLNGIFNAGLCVWRFIIDVSIHISFFYVACITTLCFAETLIMHNLPLPEELDRIADFRVFYKTQDVVIGCAGFLLCCDHVKTTAAESLEKALFFVVQAVSCCDFIRTKIEKKEDETSYPA